MTYLSVLPAHTTYIMTYRTHTFVKYLTLKFVKSLTLLRLKIIFLSRWNPGNFDPKFQRTRSPMRYDISIFFFAVNPQNFDLRQPRGATRPVSCFCFCSLFRKGHHCGNKLFPVSVSVILAENPIAEIDFRKEFYLSFRYLKSCSGDLIPQNLILCTISCGTGFITQSSWIFHFHPTITVGWNVLYRSCTNFEGASRGGQPFNIFTWFIGAFGQAPGFCIRKLRYSI